jgi:3-oxoacyl-[acyl-carrier protein] reductase
MLKFLIGHAGTFRQYMRKNSMILDLSGSVALVTGATGELGRVIARTLAECGADVAVHYHANADKAAELTAEIEGLGRRAIAVRADVSDRESVQSMRAAINDSLGAPDIVVLNAVSKYKWLPVLEQPLDDFEDQFRSVCRPDRAGDSGVRPGDGRTRRRAHHRYQH